MFQKSALIVVGPLALLLCVSPIILTSGISDLSKGAVVGIFFGLHPARLDNAPKENPLNSTSGLHWLLFAWP